MALFSFKNFTKLLIFKYNLFLFCIVKNNSNRHILNSLEPKLFGCLQLEEAEFYKLIKANVDIKIQKLKDYKFDQGCYVSLILKQVVILRMEALVSKVEVHLGGNLN